MKEKLKDRAIGEDMERTGWKEIDSEMMKV